MDNNNYQGNDNRRFRNSGPTFMILIIAAVITFFVYTMIRGFFVSEVSQEISYSAFITMVDNGQVQKVEWGTNEITVYPVAGFVPAEDSTESYGGYLNQVELKYYVVPVNADAENLVDRLLRHNVEIYKKKPDNSGFIMETIFSVVIPFALLFVLMSMTMRRMGGSGSNIMGVGKSTAKMYMQKETGVTFKDVAGEDEAKESLIEIVDFLHNPSKYTQVGAKLPKGALLVGPPGTGKTLLAKAVAGEAQVPFYSLSGSDFVEMFVGVGASRVRDLFKQASQTAPCIIFIDEIDAIGKSRESHYGGGNDEREQTLNQLLSEMDGFDASKGIMVMGATNRPEILDPALLRPGRFDRRIVVEKPDLKGRVNILKVHARDVKLDDSVDFNEIALATSGAVGADLANMMNEAAITAVKHGRKAVSQSDLFEAVEVVLVGKEKKDRILSQQERRIVSYHEVGHALVSAIQKDAEPVQKITIIPRTMGALGYVMQVPEEEKYLNTKDELHAMLVTYLAGRAAEEIVFDTVTTGAANDIEKATKLARAMVTQYGMSDKFGLMGLATQESMYLSGKTVMNCGDDTATAVDEEVMKILKESYEEAKEILRKNRFALDRIAEFLIERETITGKEFMHILHDVQKEEDMKLHPEKYTADGVRIEEQTDSDMETSSDSKTKETVKAQDTVINAPYTDVPETTEEKAKKLQEDVAKAVEEHKEKISFEEARALYTADGQKRGDTDHESADKEKAASAEQDEDQ